MSNERMLTDQEVLVHRIVDRFFTELNIARPEGKQAISPADITRLWEEMRAVFLPPDQETVSKKNLEWLADQVKDYRQFKTDAETDIGYLAQSVYNLQNMGDPMKLLPKLLMGKVDMSSLGLDVERMAGIAQKYAPVKFAELKAKEEQSKKKK